MKIVKTLFLALLLGSCLLAGCSPTDSSKSQSGESTEPSGGESTNVSGNFPWIS